MGVGIGGLGYREEVTGIWAQRYARQEFSPLPMELSLGSAWLASNEQTIGPEAKK